MTQNNQSNAGHIGKVAKYARSAVPKQKIQALEAFLRLYFANTAPDDFLSLDAKTAFEIVFSHWQLAQQRAGTKPVTSVFNADGWQTMSTIVQLVVPNMPFLVDSVRMEVNRQGFSVKRMIHPVYWVERNNKGKLKSVALPEPNKQNNTHESFIHVEIDKVVDDKQIQQLQTGLNKVLRDVQRAVADWRKMGAKLQENIEQLGENKEPVAQRKVNEVRAFLAWMEEKNFTFLGCQDYKVYKKGQQEVLRPVAGTALGVLKDKPFRNTEDVLVPSLQGVKAERSQEDLILLTKSIYRATVHRPGYMDYVAIRHFNPKGKLIGERRFVGLYTSMAYRRHPRDVPVVRTKINRVFSAGGFDAVSHTGKAFAHILETFPRDVLFQIREKDLKRIALGVLHLGENQRLKLFVKEDSLRRFVTCLVYVPRDHYDTDLRIKITDILLERFSGLDVTFNVKVTDESFARVEYVIRTDAQNFPDYNVVEIEKALLHASQTWLDQFKLELLDRLAVEQYPAILSKYAKAFPSSYQVDFALPIAVDDILVLESIDANNPFQVRLYAQQGEKRIGLKLYQRGNAIAPSDSMPILENMGVKVLQEKPYEIMPAESNKVWLHDHGLSSAVSIKNFEQLKPLFEDLFHQAWQGRVENDGFNMLCLNAGLSCREIVVLRAYCKYLLQAGLTFSQQYMEQCLNKHASIARSLLDLFNKRFDPSLQDNKSPKAFQALHEKVLAALDDVASLDEDRILRNFVGVIVATIRTNFFQSSAVADIKPYVAFKFDTAKVPELPEPRPMYEVFVYSPKTEGVHLRSGKVARGGLRWSDRREDFRTEVLGLVKAQKVKNAVIVPTGSKGGFVVKQAPTKGGRDALMQEVISCYKQFISGLLDITDNIVQGDVVPPKSVVRYDADDPYLVVAADKGTATFSDIANGVARDYGFWLDDAFASGGSLGYDHKKMGITARGAWESVKLLFRDLGKNIQKEDFTVVGIGDMGGDVFGNGMLLSKHICLVGAFNHMHIFLDPNPDSATSYKERKRLFKLPRSTWEDYNKALISKGGGIFSRSAKSISLTPEIQALLNTDRKSMAPNDLINLMLKAPVELIWNGGIGTYVKASQEQHSDAGDRSNDGLRINADELRCKVFGEGGNLGLTQKARIEYSLLGGSIDTDFIHNAGGVDCSDHEVNIKILLNAVVADGRMTEKRRAELLLSMTDEVADLVLQSNYWQGQAITLIEMDAANLLDEHSRYIKHLESDGVLDRDLEVLPTEDVLLDRKAAGQGLTRPEISVLLSYSKILAETELVNADLWDDPYYAAELLRYFPVPLRQRYAEYIHKHPLRKEILATFIVNRMVNRMGCTFVYRMQEETGASTAEIVRAYTIAWEVFQLRHNWAEVAALDNKVDAKIQLEIMQEAIRLIYRTSTWLIRHRKRALGIEAAIADFGKGAQVLMRKLPMLLAGSEDPVIRSRLERLASQGVDKQLALTTVSMDALYCTFDVVLISNQSKRPIELVVDLYFALSAYLDIFWLRIKVGEFKPDNHWQELACKALIADIYTVLRALTKEVLRTGNKKSPVDQLIAAWHKRNQFSVDRCLKIPRDLKSVDGLDMAMFAVSLRELQNLLEASAAN